MHTCMILLCCDFSNGYLFKDNSYNIHRVHSQNNPPRTSVAMHVDFQDGSAHGDDDL